MAIKAVAAGVFLVFFTTMASAHCDTMNGPVISAAMKALETRDSSWVLIWVKPAHERQISRLFQQTLKARARGGSIAERADKRFFEQVVRIHRTGEGMRYTGIKPAGTPVDPVIAASDAAIDNGTVEPLLSQLIAHVSEGLRTRYAHVAEARAHMRDSIAAGREYVEAYVAYTHYVEGVATAIHGEGHHPD